VLPNQQRSESIDPLSRRRNHMNTCQNVGTSYEVVFVNDLPDELALELMDAVAKRAQEQGISTQDYVRRWICGDTLDQAPSGVLHGAQGSSG
jgi:hypothetical protein